MVDNTHLSYHLDKIHVTKALSLFKEKMERENLPEIVVNNFLNYYEKLYNGEKGYIKEDEILPISFNQVEEFKGNEDLFQHGREALPKTAILKLNGGLGTTMGCNIPKSLIKVKNGYTFLDLSIQNLFALRKKYGIEIPLLLMNSFYSNEAIMSEISHYPTINKNLPVSFLQHKFPRINSYDLYPLTFPEERDLEWNPPGHGNLYIAILTSGLLDLLIEKGYYYLFISNIDNLGASLDLNILGYMVKNSFNFLMEVTKRTEIDRKGGHLAIRIKDKRLILRELSQCEEKDLVHFSNIKKHSLFNTNNIWLDIRELKRILVEKGFFLELPFICNPKTISYKEKNFDVFQLEYAVGSGILLFSNPSYINVPRERFMPVKNTEDLLRMASDCFMLNDEANICRMQSSHLPEINLDANYYKNIDDFVKRFSKGIPSLNKCQKLTVNGDVYFGENVTIKGRVEIVNKTSQPYYIPDNSVIDNNLIIKRPLCLHN